MVSRRLFGSFLLTFCVSAVALHDSSIVCSQGLSKCSITDDLPLTPHVQPNVEAVSLEAHAELCCENRTRCKACLVIDVQLHILLGEEVEDNENAALGQQGGEANSGEREEFVTVCYTANILPVCKKVEFTVDPATLPPQNRTWLSLVINEPVAVSFGSRVFIHVYPNKSPHPYLELVVTSLEQACSLDLDGYIEQCDVPRLNSVIDLERNQVELQVADHNRSLMCLQNERNGKCQTWSRKTIPLYVVTSCLCLQVWWDAGDQRPRRALSCPFINCTGVVQRNVWQNLSMSVALVRKDAAVLLWNLSAPCRLQAEVWPCRRTTGAVQRSCKEIKGLKQQLPDRNWMQNKKGHWEIRGSFENIDPQFAPCVMVKVKDMPGEMGPFCINDIDRWRWSLLIFTAGPLFGLTVVILYFRHDKIKRWAHCWHQSKSLQTGKKHVVLLSPPDHEDSVSELVCGLGSFLRDGGLSVSVDQWSRGEQRSAGPLLWLHSQLLRLDLLGGRVLLVLTQKACERVEEWTEEWTHRRQQPPGQSSPYSDMFTASLCCIAADRQLDKAAERFLLVRFESCPAEPQHGARTVPALLRGLPLFQLPSQTQALLTELSAGHKDGGGGRRRKTNVK